MQYLYPPCQARVVLHGMHPSEKWGLGHQCEWCFQKWVSLAAKAGACNGERLSDPWIRAGLPDQKGNRQSDSSGERPCPVSPLADWATLCSPCCVPRWEGLLEGGPRLVGQRGECGRRSTLPAKNPHSSRCSARPEQQFACPGEIDHGRISGRPSPVGLHATNANASPATSRSPGGSRRARHSGGAAVWCRCWLWQRSCTRLHGPPNRA